MARGRRGAHSPAIAPQTPTSRDAHHIPLAIHRNAGDVNFPIAPDASCQNMDLLPPELLSNIVGFLGEFGTQKRLGPYASISLAWQTAIEQRTFNNIRIDVDVDTLAHLRYLLTADNGRRTYFLRTLDVDLGESPLDEQVVKGIPSRIDPAWWIAATHHLFSVLAQITTYVETPPPLCLNFLAYTRTSQVAHWKRILCHAATSIPTLRQVTKITWKHPIFFVSETDLFGLIRHLPNLAECNIDTWDRFSWGGRERTKRREGT